MTETTDSAASALSGETPGLYGSETFAGIADEDALEGEAPGASGASGTFRDGSGGAPGTEDADWELSADDLPVPEENLRSFSARCRELGLSREQAEGLLGWHKEQFARDAAEAESGERDVLDAWKKEILADRDFGGMHMKRTVADARRALAAFDPDGSLRRLLRETRYQYHPQVIRAVAAVGRAMGEHGFVNGSGGSAPRPLADRYFERS